MKEDENDRAAIDLAYRYCRKFHKQGFLLRNDEQLLKSAKSYIKGGNFRQNIETSRQWRELWLTERTSIRNSVTSLWVGRFRT